MEQNASRIAEILLGLEDVNLIGVEYLDDEGENCLFGFTSSVEVNDQSSQYVAV